ncbi:MAG: hypothetical protein K6G73_12875 [Marinilabiliaceae bacterium]|nr:hypothetical protein [Marinilabiliaceae bacterium]
MNGIPMINGNVYTWADITVLIGGVPITGITGVKYADEQEVENVYGAGRYPVGRAKGKITCTASLKLLIDEVRGLASKSPTGRLQDLGVFDVQVSYLPEESGKIVHDVIHDCQFSKTEVDWSEGDKSKDVDLELVVSRIEWGRL